jgi:hypothetical protein
MSDLGTKKRRIKLADYGRTICQVCDGSLNDGRPTAEIDGTETFHVQRNGFTYKRERPVKRRIHTDCLRADEARRQAAMRASKIDAMTGLYRAYRDDLGMTPEKIEQLMRDKTDLTDDEIEQIRAAVQ